MSLSPVHCSKRQLYPYVFFHRAVGREVWRWRGGIDEYAASKAVSDYTSDLGTALSVPACVARSAGDACTMSVNEATSITGECTSITGTLYCLPTCGVTADCQSSGWGVCESGVCMDKPNLWMQYCGSQSILPDMGDPACPEGPQLSGAVVSAVEGTEHFAVFGGLGASGPSDQVWALGEDVGGRGPCGDFWCRG